MPTININDLNNAKLDSDTIAGVATSTALTVTDRLGNVKATVFGAVQTLKAFNVRGPWATATTYALKDTYTFGGYAYVVVMAHTSTTVAADLTSGYVTLHQGATREDLAASGGAGLVGYMQAGPGAVARTLQDKQRDIVSVKDFGAKGDGVTDDTAAITAFRNYLFSLTVLPLAVWEAGTYIYSVSPNWNIPRLKMRSQGVVRLRYTGTGDAFIINDTNYVGLYDQEIGHFTIEAPSNALNGVHITSAHHSKYDFNVRGCGLTSAGLLVNYSVCNEYRITVSNNENGTVPGWYIGANGIQAKPTYGVFLDQRNINEAATANIFINPILEGAQFGAFLQNATGNTFIGGTMEGCSNKGVNLQPGAVSNVFYNVDYEANTAHDIYCLGNYNEFHQCQTMTLVSFDGTANGNHLVGGIHQQIALTAATVRNRVRDLIFNRFAAAGYVISDTSGRQNIITDVTNYLDGSTGNGDLTQFDVTVGASPFSYTNNTRQPLLFAYGGGAVSTGSLKRGVSQITIGGAYGNVVLKTGDIVTLVFTATPSAVVFPQ